MYCTNCGVKTPEGAKFCGQCGTAIIQDLDRPTGYIPTIPTVGVDPQTGGLFADEPHPHIQPAPQKQRIKADEFVDTAAIRRELTPGTVLFVAIHGPNTGARFLVNTPVVSVGRHPESGIFLDDITVSRRHSEFRINPQTNEVSLVDEGSLNGTYVNGTRQDQCVLANADVVQIGKFRLQALFPLTVQPHAVVTSPVEDPYTHPTVNTPVESTADSTGDTLGGSAGDSTGDALGGSAGDSTGNATGDVSGEEITDGSGGLSGQDDSNVTNTSEAQ